MRNHNQGTRLAEGDKSQLTHGLGALDESAVEGEEVCPNTQAGLGTKALGPSRAGAPHAPKDPSCRGRRSRSSAVMHVTPELEVLGSNPGGVGTQCPRR